MMFRNPDRPRPAHFAALQVANSSRTPALRHPTPSFSHQLCQAFGLYSYMEDIILVKLRSSSSLRPVSEPWKVDGQLLGPGPKVSNPSESHLNLMTCIRFHTLEMWPYKISHPIESLTRSELTPKLETSPSIFGSGTPWRAWKECIRPSLSSISTGCRESVLLSPMCS